LVRVELCDLQDVLSANVLFSTSDVEDIPQLSDLPWRRFFDDFLLLGKYRYSQASSISSSVFLDRLNRSTRKPNRRPSNAEIL
jgi:hypothetical protein